MPYIEKIITSGPMVEIERYAVAKNGARLPRRDKEKPSTLTQENLNDKNAAKQFIRLLNANFIPADDLFVTATFRELRTEAEARTEAKNFRRRLATAYRQKGIELKTAMIVGQGERGRWHIHIVLTGGLSIRELRDVWGKGIIHITPLEQSDFGFEGVARYFMEHWKKGRRRWIPSCNLAQPKVERNVIDRLDIFKKPKLPRGYKNGYKIVDVKMGDNLYTGQWQTIILRKLEAG